VLDMRVIWPPSANSRWEILIGAPSGLAAGA
jgi:hypothetical protein